MTRGQFNEYPAGYQWGAWTVLRDRQVGERTVQCRCECGKVRQVATHTIGRTNSCGCLNAGRNDFPNTVFDSDGQSVWFLVGNLPVVVDYEDVAKIAVYKWGVLRPREGHRRYAVAKPSRKLNDQRSFIYMHRLIAETPDGLETDHVNGNGLDNRRCNLRPASTSENTANTWKPQLRRPLTSRFKGVSRRSVKTGWQAFIGTSETGEQRTRYLGTFVREEDAAAAYDDAAWAAWGEFAQLNFSRSEAS